MACLQRGTSSPDCLEGYKRTLCHYWRLLEEISISLFHWLYFYFGSCRILFTKPTRLLHTFHGLMLFIFLPRCRVNASKRRPGLYTINVNLADTC